MYESGYLTTPYSIAETVCVGFRLYVVAYSEAPPNVGTLLGLSRRISLRIDGLLSTVCRAVWSSLSWQIFRTLVATPFAGHSICR